MRRDSKVETVTQAKARKAREARDKAEKYRKLGTEARKALEEAQEAPENATEAPEAPEAPEADEAPQNATEAPEAVSYFVVRDGKREEVSLDEAQEARLVRRDRNEARSGRAIIGSDGETYFVANPFPKGKLPKIATKYSGYDIVLAPYTAPASLGGTDAVPNGRQSGNLATLGCAAYFVAQDIAAEVGSLRYPAARYFEALSDLDFRKLGTPGSIDDLTGQRYGARDGKHIEHDRRNNLAVLFLRPSDPTPDSFLTQAQEARERRGTVGRTSAPEADGDTVTLSPEDRELFVAFRAAQRKAQREAEAQSD